MRNGLTLWDLLLALCFAAPFSGAIMAGTRGGMGGLAEGFGTGLLIGAFCGITWWIAGKHLGGLILKALPERRQEIALMAMYFSALASAIAATFAAMTVVWHLAAK